MKITSEWDLLDKIDRLVRDSGASAEGLVLGIGDDCAAFWPRENRLALLTTDISIEGVHFNRDYFGAGDIGYRTMAANISDIASMGGDPRYAVIAIGLPPGTEEEYVLDLYRGFLEAACIANTAIAGGDISLSDRLVISIALHGDVPEDRIVRRRGARAGDRIYVTGTLGDSRAGLQILGAVSAGGEDTGYPHLSARHRRPDIRWPAIKEITTIFRPSAMIDISDGLLSDLGHVCRASGTGFVLFEEKMPLSDELVRYAGDRGSALPYALKGGEDYELLFTSGTTPDAKIALPRGIPVTMIGEITEGGFFISGNGQKHEIETKGYDHFDTER